MNIKNKDISSFSNNYNSNVLLFLENRPQVQFWIKSYSLPDISLDVVDVELPNNTLKLPGNTLTFGDFSVTLLVDENFIVYKEIFDWIEQIALRTKKNNATNGSLWIFNNHMNKIVATMDFKDLIITSIGSLDYNNFDQVSQTLSLGFAYSIFRPDFKIQLLS